MKTIEEVRKEWICSKCKRKTDCYFQAENVHCNECKNDFDLGMKKHE